VASSAPASPGATDQSTPFQPGTGYFQVLPDTGAREVRWCGRVVDIQPDTDGVKVVIDGGTPDSGGTLLVRLPSKVSRPFAVGDIISAHLVVRRVAIHRVVEGTIAGADGTLLMAFSQDGTIDFAPGWGLELGRVVETGTPHMPGGARRRTHVVQLSYAGRTAHVPPDGWRRLSTAAGDFLVTGGAVSWTEGPRLPDATAYTQYAVVRLGR
jgi:hypothetical protein